MPDEMATRLVQAALARSKVASRNPVLPARRGPPPDSVELRALAVLFAPQDTTSLSDPAIELTLRSRPVVGDMLIKPIVSSGIVQPSDVLNRVFMVPRLRDGATWDYQRCELTGGRDSLELLTLPEYRLVGYIPFFLPNDTRVIRDPLTATGLVIDNPPEVQDPALALGRRSDQVKWLLTYEL